MLKLPINAIVLALALALCCTILGQAKEAPAPSFKPGAEVKLRIKLKAPASWKISHVPAIRLSFDAAALKSASFSVAKAKWEYNPGKYVKEYTAGIPITIKPGTKDGLLSVPLDLACSICDESGVRCSFVNEDLVVKVQVQAKAGKGEADQAQGAGELAYEYKLSPPL